MKKTLTELAKVIRSKNCSPFELTLDIIFTDRNDYEKVKETQQFNKEVIARLYSIKVDEVKSIIYFSPAKAIKIVLNRTQPSGCKGDKDVYGAQQHAPLLNLFINL
ncbi:DUF4387 domain-containing protein [Shewanella surugensis]|uniref:DUF4387 domain-containing protein n=1 Tax=Shewanella surugensis TaxID=212020 RepID=A0ABT0LCQ7_9GAMM|nr:DUF4387 domain-containing protein [Shewanella surugensis]MCL1125494.1 DUF4387 domain-containing protein [Shewanella surugensis]